MSALEAEITETLRTLDPEDARSLERLIHDMLVLVRHRSGASSPPTTGQERTDLDANGYPVGHFERLVGSWADLDLELPDDPPPGPAPDWR